MRTLVVAYAQLVGEPGVSVVDATAGTDVTRTFVGSDTAHQHYEVRHCTNGAWWVPASTHPPREWERPILITGNGGVNPGRNEYRPSGIYFWIPEAAIRNLGLTPGDSRGDVADAHPPNCP